MRNWRVAAFVGGQYCRNCALGHLLFIETLTGHLVAPEFDLRFCSSVKDNKLVA